MKFTSPAKSKAFPKQEELQNSEKGGQAEAAWLRTALASCTHLPSIN